MNRLSDEWFSSKSESVPLWHKIALSIDEMYVYTGIGRETIRELTKQPEAKQFTLKIGKRTLIKRKQFEEKNRTRAGCKKYIVRTFVSSASFESRRCIQQTHGI